MGNQLKERTEKELKGETIFPTGPPPPQPPTNMAGAQLVRKAQDPWAPQTPRLPSWGALGRPQREQCPDGLKRNTGRGEGTPEVARRC